MHDWTRRRGGHHGVTGIIPGVMISLIVAGLCALPGIHGARAATISVTTVDDELNLDGDCSLREAIAAANGDTPVDGCAAGAGLDIVTVPAGLYVLALAGAGEDGGLTGDLDITSDLDLAGAGAGVTVIDGASLDRVVDVDPAAAGVKVEIRGVTIQNGLAPQQGTLSSGGGVLNRGALTMTECAIRKNTGVALGTFGGGIFNFGSLTVDRCSVVDNDGNTGGGIYSHTGSDLLVRDSTVSGNSVGAYGGGINNRGSAMVENSTISGNTAFSGGGIKSWSTMTISSSTVTGNFATWGGGVNQSGGPVTLENTIVAMNMVSGGGGDCIGSTSSAGHNLDSDGTCLLVAGGDLSGADPLLGPLADNGGPTSTHALLDGSPAIDAASAMCPPPGTDQRGVARPQGAGCDMGSFEHVQVTMVDIDIRPGSFPNNINLDIPGVVPVAILSSETFDAGNVDGSTLAFSGSRARLRGRSGLEDSLEDVDGDGDLDLVAHFPIDQLGLTPESTMAVLNGELFDSTRIQGTDSVRIVPDQATAKEGRARRSRRVRSFRQRR